MAELKNEDFELMQEDKEESISIEKELRKGFIRKVYGTIFFQLLVTTGVVYYVMINESLQKFMQENVYISLILFVLAIGIMLIIFCTKLSQKVPINYILLMAFTVLEAIMVSFTTIYFEPLSVLTCAGVTMVVVFGLTMYACFSKRDLTVMGGFLVSLSLILLFLGLIGIFFRSYFYEMFLNCFGVLLTSIYLIFDTQLVIGEKKNFISMDLYILAALTIYIDIIVLFIRILRIFGTKKK